MILFKIATGCLLDYHYFEKFYKMIAIDLSKQQVLEADPKAIRQNDFIGNLERVWNTNTAMHFIVEETKEMLLGCSQGTVF